MSDKLLRSISIVVIFCQLSKGNHAPNINYSHNMRILKLPRKLPSGTLVYRLKGSDSDPDVLTFGVKGRVGSSLLEIKSVSFTEADVYLKSQLKEKEYNFTIYVSDGQISTEVDATILVTDTDQPIESPFVNLNQLYSVLENATKYTSVGFVTVRDRNSSSLPATFELRGSDKFTIRYVFGPRGTSKSEILLVKPLDYEQQNLYFLTLLALNAWTNETFNTRNIAATELLIAVKDVVEPKRSVALSNVVYVGFPKDFDTIFWILLGFVVLTVLFLLLLLICWCCCRYWPNRREKMIALQEYHDKERLTLEDGRGSKLSQQENSMNKDHIDSKGRTSSQLTNSEYTMAGSRMENGYGSFRTKRNRIAPAEDEQQLSDDNNAYYSDRDVETGHHQRRRGRRRYNRHGGANSTGTYVIDNDIYSGRFKMSRNKRIKPHKTEILYIRSPLHDLRQQENNARSASEAAMRIDERDEYATPSTADTSSRRSTTTKPRRQVSFKTNSSDGVIVPGTVSISDQEEHTFTKPFERHRSVSNITLSSQAYKRPTIGGKTPPARASSTPASRVRHATLPGSVEDDASTDMNDETEKKFAMYNIDDSRTIDTDDKSEQADEIPPDYDDDADRAKKDPPTSQLNNISLKPDNTQIKDVVSEKSDTDSGLGRDASRHVSELNLKNSNLMLKKSIFTVAYDGVKTNRLKSAESGAESA